MSAPVYHKDDVEGICDRAKRSAKHDVHPCSITIDAVAPAVERVEATAAHITSTNRAWLFFGIFLIAYAYGLDGILRFSYQPIAVSDLGDHSLLATVTVIRAVIGAAAQPTAAKIADVFGRMELIILTVGFYVVGTVIEASSTSIAVFAFGSVWYQIGYTSMLLLVEVVIADVTSLRARLLFSYIPAVPFCINSFIGGEVLNAVLGAKNWRWGIGMWAIIYPVAALPLVATLWWINYKTKMAGHWDNCPTPFQKYGGWRLAKALFWQLDVVGIILIICIFGFILVPFTIAGGILSSWTQAKIIAPMIIGVLLIPVWIVWEKVIPHPMVPFFLLTDRGVWSPLGIAVMLMFAWSCQGDFLFSVVRIAFDESAKSASRITAIYSFTSTLTGVIVGLMVYRVRQLKPFIVIGTVLFMGAFGLLIHFRGGPDARGGLIGGQILLGIAGGFFPYAAQASIQAATQHEHTAVITGLYLSTYNIGSALGNMVSGIIFNQVLPKELEKRLDPKVLQSWYHDPMGLLPTNPIGTPARDAVVESYKYVQRVVCIIGACVCVSLIGFAFCLRDPILPDYQSIPHTQEDLDNVTEQGPHIEMFPAPRTGQPFYTEEEQVKSKKWWNFWKR